MPIFTRAMKCTSLLIVMVHTVALADWNVDFSRRQNQMGKVNGAAMSPDPTNSLGTQKSEEKSLIDRVFEASLPTQDIVVINTEQGFIPSTVRVKEGSQYRIIIVNVNEKARNVSFVLDSFSEHHATFYGKVKSFYITPKKEGVYSFISPETSAQGRLVVYPGPGPATSTTEALPEIIPAPPATEARTPASE